MENKKPENEDTYYCQDISCDDIRVSAPYQRLVKESQAKKIANEYNPKAFGALIVGRRDDGTHWCVDGQTRLRAAIIMELKVVPCTVFRSDGEQDEAAAFRDANSRRAMSQLHKHNALKCQKDPNTLEMVKIVENAGFVISEERNWPSIRAITDLIRAYEAGVLARLLHIIESSWGVTEDKVAIQTPMIGGLTRFLIHHSDVVDDIKLIKRLQEHLCESLMKECNAQKMLGGSRKVAMYEVIVKHWNKGRTQTNRIQPVF